MPGASRARGPETTPQSLRLHRPPEIVGAVRWLINGCPATVLIWTADEWARLIDRPHDAQPSPNGTWCALRID